MDECYGTHRTCTINTKSLKRIESHLDAHAHDHACLSPNLCSPDSALGGFCRRITCMRLRSYEQQDILMTVAR